MNKSILLLFVLFLFTVTVSAQSKIGKEIVDNEYAVVAGKGVMNDPEWKKVVDQLQKIHQAPVFQYETAPAEVLKELQKTMPRYVAFVEKPENIGPDYVGGINLLSRQVDGDMYADFLWGIITGYDAGSALKMVDNATEPLVVRKMLSTSAFRDPGVSEWFERYAWMDDYHVGMWGQKKADGQITFQALTPTGTPTENSTSGYKMTAFQASDYFDKFCSLYRETEPDCFLTGSYNAKPRWNSEVFAMSDFKSVSTATAFQFNLPFFEKAVIKAKAGKVYAGGPDKPRPLLEAGNRKVYIAAGDDFGGNVANSKESMPVAWMSGGNAAAVIGYIVPDWFGIGSFGTVKYWITNAGRYSLPEAAFLNRQHLISRLNRWSPELTTMNFPYGQMDQAVGMIAETSGIPDPGRALIGCLYDRDVVAYYGDPKWNVRLQENAGSRKMTVTSERKGKQYVITVVTHADFTMAGMAGDNYQAQCTLDLPFSYFFPERLRNARLAAGQKWDVALDENFIFVYDAGFTPNQTYRIVLDVEG